LELGGLAELGVRLYGLKDLLAAAAFGFDFVGQLQCDVVQVLVRGYVGLALIFLHRYVKKNSLLNLI
jgi:hypothetical protein